MVRHSLILNNDRVAHVSHLSLTALTCTSKQIGLARLFPSETNQLLLILLHPKSNREPTTIESVTS